ncbi:DDE endonuclease [Streptomyces shenzhenensis]
MAGPTCYKPGKRSRMFYSVREYRGRKGGAEGHRPRDLRDLLVRAHIQLGGPIVLVWDNLRMHLVEPLHEFIAAHADRLTGFRATRRTSTRKRASGRWSSATSATLPQPTSAGSPAPSSAGSSRSGTARTWSTGAWPAPV